MLSPNVEEEGNDYDGTPKNQDECDPAFHECNDPR
jgi:hypothetical protein